jgi:hypothetical protein
MPRFYFHFKRGEEVELDAEGLDFPSMEEAYLEAFRAAVELWGELLAKRQDPTTMAFEICDSAGNHLLTLPFSEVLHSTKAARTGRR